MIFGGGAGAFICLGEHLLIKFELSALNYWYDETKIYSLDDGIFDQTDDDGNKFALLDRDYKPCTGDQGCYEYRESDDTDDKDSEFLFPLITVGMVFLF